MTGCRGPAGWLTLTALVLSWPASAQHLAFVACPIAQDRGPRLDVCFFAIHNGVRYGLTSPTDWGAPQLGHKVLVEGEVTDGQPQCGGVPIDGQASVIPELSPECNEIAPATPTFASEPVPARAILGDADRALIEADPLSSLRIVRLAPLPTPEVALGQTETIYFPFERDRASGPGAMVMLSLARLASVTEYPRVLIRAYQGATLLDTGEVLAERSDMAAQRGTKVAGILTGLGVPAEAVDVVIFHEPPSPSGQEDWRNRRVEITVSGHE